MFVSTWLADRRSLRYRQTHWIVLGAGRREEMTKWRIIIVRVTVNGSVYGVVIVTLAQPLPEFTRFM